MIEPYNTKGQQLQLFSLSHAQMFVDFGFLTKKNGIQL